MGPRRNKYQVPTAAPPNVLTLEYLFKKIEDNHNSVNRRLDDILLKLENVTSESKQTTLAEVKKLKDEVLPDMIKSQRDEVKSFMDRHVKLEAHGRRLNIIISGMDDTPVVDEDGREIPEDVDAAVRKLFIDKLELEPALVNGFLFRDLHRLGRRSTVRVKARAVIVAFIQQKDRNLVMSKAFKLKGKGVSLKSDLPKELSAQRDKLLMERKTLQERNIIARVCERGYLPVLETKRGNKWVPYSLRVESDDFTNT